MAAAQLNRTIGAGLGAACAGPVLSLVEGPVPSLVEGGLSSGRDAGSWSDLFVTFGSAGASAPLCHPERFDLAREA